MDDVVAPLDRLLDNQVLAAEPLAGGDVARCYRLTLAEEIGVNDGERGSRTVFAKTHDHPLPGFFSTEATGLAWLREIDAVAVPKVIAVSDDPPWLVLQWIEPGVAQASTEETFGRALAALHQAGASAFGRIDRRTTGSRRLPNDPCDSWAEFFATRRLLPLARLAADDGALDQATVAAVESIAARLEHLVGPPEPAARLHGDLWAGNRLIGSGGTNWLIDPAAFAGHREFDLAMMRLFGGFGPASFDAYEEVTPLAEGWEDRVGLYQVAPLIVHAIKFGGPYVDATRQTVGRLL